MLEPMDIINRFKLKYWDTLYHDMNAYSHDCEPSINNNTDDGFSKFHAEGSIWSHTIAVLSNLIENNYSNELILAGLLHDIGKIPSYNTRIKEDKENNKSFTKTTFYSHECLSTFLAYNIINNLFTHDELIDNNIHLYHVLNIINYHCMITNYMFNKIENINTIEKEILKTFHNNSKLYNDLLKITYADIVGRIGYRDSIINAKNNLPIFKKIGTKISNNININPNLPQAIMLIGLPYSGKSTIRTAIIEDNNQNHNYSIISLDDIIEKEAIKRNITYNELFSSDKEFITASYENLYNEFVKKAKNKENLIIDKTNLSFGTRKKYLQHLNDYTKICIFIMATDDVINDRRKNNNDKIISEDVINNMKKQLMFPNYGEFDLITKIGNNM
jgi:predicted kinase